MRVRRVLEAKQYFSSPINHTIMNDNLENALNPAVIMPIQEQGEPLESEVNSRRSLSDIGRIAIITAEVFPPISGSLRYGALALAETQTTSPWVGAAVLGGTTLALEWGSYRAGVGWIAENKIAPVIDGIRQRVSGYHDRIEQFKESLSAKHPKTKPGRFVPGVPTIPENPEPGAKMPLWVQGGIGLELGTVVLLSTKQEVDRSRDLKVNKRDGRVSVALVSGALALQGAAISAGVEFIENDAEVGFSILGAAVATYGLWKLIQNKRAARKAEKSDEGQNDER